jgi:hypothetical protein
MVSSCQTSAGAEPRRRDAVYSDRSRAVHDGVESRLGLAGSPFRTLTPRPPPMGPSSRGWRRTCTPRRTDCWSGCVNATRCAVNFALVAVGSARAKLAALCAVNPTLEHTLTATCDPDRARRGQLHTY